MKKRSCYLFVFEGFADWEPSLVTAGLSNWGNFRIATFSLDGEPVRSMGNLMIKPDFRLNEVKVTDFDLLILPGGNKWEEGGNTEISAIVMEAFHQGKTVAAICAATSFLASLGIYKEIKHTSNGLDYLKKQVPEYSSESNYCNEPCSADKNIITANGAAMIEFAYKIFKHFQICPDEDLQWWLTFYKSGGMIYEKIP